jgi:hypothetical protein
MWRTWRRLRQLEAEIARARNDGADLRMRLAQIESIAAAAGAAQPPVPSAPMPPTLVAAAADARLRDVPVRLDVAGAEVIAIVSGDGDPREWWTAIWGMAGPDDIPEISESSA